MEACSSRLAPWALCLAAGCTASLVEAAPPREEPSTNWNELTRWLPEARWGQWAEISAVLKTWSLERLAKLEPTLRKWDAERRYPWLRVLDPETTQKWLEGGDLTPQERWLARWSDRLHITDEQLAQHREVMTQARWWAQSPVVVGPTAERAGWWVVLPEADFDLHLRILKAIDESGDRLVRLGFHGHQRVDAERLAASPHVQHLEHLYLMCSPRTQQGRDAVGSPTWSSSDGHCLSDRDLRALSASQTLVRLRKLDLARNRITAAGLAALAASKTLSKLTHLNLRANHQLLGPVVEVLARFPSLREVDLSDIIGLDLRVMRPTSLPALEQLRVQRGSLRDVDFARFIAMTKTPKLTHLRADRNRKLGSATARAIAADADLSGLRVLDLHGAKLGDVAASGLAASEMLSGLRELRLGKTGAGKATARAVVRNAKLRLRALNLSAQGGPGEGTITASTARALARCAHLADLSFLDLSFHPLGEDGLVALARSPYLGSLEHLALNWTGATDRSATALAEAPKLARLRYFTLGGKGLGSAAFLAFARARHMTRLYHLRLYGPQVSAEAGRALRDAPHLKRTRL